MANVERWARLSRWFMVAWVLFTIPSLVSVVASGLGPSQLAVAFAFLVWGVNWIWFWTRALGRSSTAEVVGFVANTVIMSLFAFFSPDSIGAGGVLVFSFIIAGVTFPLRKALWVIFGLTVLQAALMTVRLEPLPIEVSSLINSLLVGGVGIGARLLWQSYVQLYAAREQLAQVAVSEERLRFARDLHDLLGQNLAVLVLKSELVSKQLPADANEATHQELRDIARVARRSLNDVREAAAGYRRPSLSMEVVNARTALRAAGIGLQVEDTLGRVAAEQDAVLAWCVREGITNVVKHSQARRCVLRLARKEANATLEISDDGVGMAKLDGGGIGLIGLRERVELAGGKMDVRAQAEGGLRLRVSLPAAAAAPSELPVA